MSRSTRDKARRNDFPVGECVTDVYVDTCKLVKSPKTGKVSLRIIFKKGEKILPVYWAPPTEQFWGKYIKVESDLKEKIKTEKKRLQDCIDHFFSTFNDSGDMIDARQNAKGFISYCNNLIESATSNGMFETALDLKTIPDVKKFVTLPKFPFFVRKKGDSQIELKYNRYENKLFENNLR